MKTRRFLLAVAAAAMAFTFSCTDDGEESDIAGFMDALNAITAATPPVDEIAIAHNTGFLVSTSEGNLVAVIITASGIQAVTLKSINLMF